MAGSSKSIRAGGNFAALVIMTVRNRLFFSALILFAHVTATALAEGRGAVPAPFGEYLGVALRYASDVATIANPNAGMEFLDQRVSFGEGQLTWLNGKTCKLWSVREVDSPVILLDDLNLSDLAIPPLNSGTSSGNKSVNIQVDLICQDNGEQKMGSFVIIDTRVLVVSVPPWSVNLILERTLTKDQVKKFQVRLKDMSFHDGAITGELDEATLRSVGFYAEYRGSEFRFLRTAITENLLDGLGVLDRVKNGGKATFTDDRSKQSMASTAPGENEGESDPGRTEIGCRVSPMALLPRIATDDYTNNPFTFEREVDGDGVVDVLRLQESGGSSAFSKKGTLTLSATDEVIELTSDVSFSSMITIHIVPLALVGNNRTAARLLVEDALFGVICNEPEPSLSRLLAMDGAVVWRKGRPALPGNYTVYYPEAPVGLIPFIGAWSELGFGIGKPVAVWVEYLGATHAPESKDKRENIRLLDEGFEVLAMTSRYRALGTRHGVVVVDVAADRYTWIYVFKDGHNLRWKSIKSATIDGSKVTIAIRIENPDARQAGMVTVDLYDGKYTETWLPD